MRSRLISPLGIMAAAVILLAIPAAIADTRVSQQLYRMPPDFDRFLSAVRAITPLRTRFLVVDASTDPQRHLYMRAAYDLYPRAVVYQPAPAQAYASTGATRISWNRVMRAARLHHVAYIVVWSRPAQSNHHPIEDGWGWSLPAPPAGRLPMHAVRLRSGWGWLVRVRP